MHACVRVCAGESIPNSQMAVFALRLAASVLQASNITDGAGPLPVDTLIGQSGLLAVS